MPKHQLWKVNLLRLWEKLHFRKDAYLDQYLTEFQKVLINLKWPPYFSPTPLHTTTHLFTSNMHTKYPKPSSTTPRSIVVHNKILLFLVTCRNSESRSAMDKKNVCSSIHIWNSKTLCLVVPDLSKCINLATERCFFHPLYSNAINTSYSNVENLGSRKLYMNKCLYHKVEHKTLLTQ